MPVQPFPGQPPVAANEISAARTSVNSGSNAEQPQCGCGAPYKKGAAELMDHQASNKSTFLFKQIKPCFTSYNARAHPYNCVTMGSHRVSFDQFLDRMAPTLASRSRPPYIFVFRSHSPLAHKLCIPAAFNPTPVCINLSNPLCRPNPVHTYRLQDHVCRHCRIDTHGSLEFLIFATLSWVKFP